MLKYTQTPAWHVFLLCYDPFKPNGSRLGPFGSKRVDFWRVPDKAPRAEGGRGEETSPHVLARPNQRSYLFLCFFVRHGCLKSQIILIVKNESEMTCQHLVPVGPFCVFFRDLVLEELDFLILWWSFTLRACPPTRLYAPNVYAPSYARSVPCKRLVSVPPWVGPHPQRTQGSPPQGPPPPPPPRDPPTPPQPPVSPSGRLFRVDGYSKWMAFPSAWLFRGVLLQLNTRTCSDSVNAESIDCFGGVIVPSVQSQRGAACKDLAQEHPKSSPGAPRSTPRAPSST